MTTGLNDFFWICTHLFAKSIDPQIGLRFSKPGLKRVRKAYLFARPGVAVLGFFYESDLFLIFFNFRLGFRFSFTHFRQRLSSDSSLIKKMSPHATHLAVRCPAFIQFLL
jgi:hypothetical protein